MITLTEHGWVIPGEREYVQKAHGRSPVRYLADLGYLSPSLVAAHCVFLSEDDVAIFAESGAHLSHTAYLVGKRGYFPRREGQAAAERVWHRAAGLL